MVAEVPALVELGRCKEAITAYEQDIAIFRETATATANASPWITSAPSCTDCGGSRDAIAAHRDTAAIFRETGDEHTEGVALES
jgi:hypothetical protein